MSRDAKLIHQKNVWMLVLLGCFFAAGLFMNILINRNAMAVQPLLGFVLLLILAGFVWNGRWPTATMLLAIFLLFIYLFVVIWNERSFTSYIFLGLLPLLSLFYQNYTAVALAGALYLSSGVYFFYKLQNTMFAESTNVSDTAYIAAYGVLILTFSLITTMITRKLSDRAEHSEGRLKAILESVSVGIWTYDFGEMKLTVSDGFEQITGYPASLFEQSPERVTDMIHPEDQHMFFESQQEMILGRTSSVKECRILRPDGEVRWIQSRGTPYFNAMGHLVRLEGIIIEVTDRKQLEETVHYLAYHDELTGLPNRTKFGEKFAECVSKGDYPLALLFLDLNNFKDVNDTYGHEAGDHLLKQIAVKLSSLIRENDMVCRMGGDEFVILLTHLDTDGVLKVVERILANLSEGCEYRGVRLGISASVGVSFSPDGGSSLEEMLRQADATMYDAKRGTTGAYRFYGDRRNETERVR
ncbi:MAG: sensor domain-containing diguanylate cyclase [Paenibacillus macerans]|uniref:Diguanylate cyclase n=1 Tax=Paenibacillus macerans TaxID=44252 RepID=A0A090Y6Y8_PAEMA|nr:sensor domain-containing diguanylate cyclase [Paenibacillus macerans]KFM94239.1 diguanylate cyclase domain protein [Paenibacillus macerans]MBS5910975.1 sensor domain-containing diguanylate cyclase [Paenibacillus macerans]MCY7558703.1 sensor domain-containing diguanylate cyclase [Paenibacillus macerans]MDU7473172.1 sensor domain-containing diguanylate cyclase [Paenibacillus macerans]MEC0139823.1 sensor domain-containing diguanylate cyclase [Paenibacillus macerans]